MVGLGVVERDRGHERAGPAEQQRVAVCGRFDDRCRAHIAVGTGTVFHHEGLAEHARQFFGNQTRQRIGTAARRGGHDHAHRFAWPGVGVRALHPRCRNRKHGGGCTQRAATRRGCWCCHLIRHLLSPSFMKWCARGVRAKSREIGALETQYDFGMPSTRSAMWLRISSRLTGAMRGIMISRR